MKNAADHSLPYIIAVAVADSHVLPDSFRGQKLHDPRIRGLLDKIKVVADPEIDALFPGVKRARVKVTTNAGWTYGAQVDHARGSLEDPLSDEELVA